MMDVQSLAALLGGLGAGGALTEVTRWWLRRRNRRLDTSEIMAVRIRRELDARAQRALENEDGMEGRYDELRERYERLLSEISDERRARHRCQERLDELDARVGRLEECRQTCNHTPSCPVAAVP